MKTRANRADIEKLVTKARAKGWTITEDKDRFSHVLQLSSPITRHGMWATITIGCPEKHPRISVTWNYHKGRAADRGLWHAEYALNSEALKV